MSGEDQSAPETASAGNGLTRALQTGLGIILLVVVAINVLNAGSRYLFGISPVGADELMIYLIIWITMIAAVLSFFTRTHISVDLVPLYTPKHARHVWYILHDLIAIFACAFATHASWLFIAKINRIGVTSMGLGIPMTIPHAALLFGFAGLTIAGAVMLVVDLMALIRKAPETRP
ncbi:TRAP transporter small permease [Martelella limonii]|uniref:TRAP transporter small permease n=1 Tax=Martelella limonii TaxID=1647649 RepID=UPI001580AB86|nr:TRAP transporter small permease [Martelella limonii]